MAAFGKVHHSTKAVELTESETEYVVSCVKHVMTEHIVLEFVITNTIAEQLLIDTCINLESTDSAETYNVIETVNAPILRCGIAARAWLVLQCNPDSLFGSPAQFMAELKFRVVEVDPISGDVEGDEHGFQEEYPLEDVEILSADFIAEVLVPIFLDYDCVLGQDR